MSGITTYGNNMQKHLSICPGKHVRSWSHISWVTTDSLSAKTFCQSVQKNQVEGKREEKLES